MSSNWKKFKFIRIHNVTIDEMNKHLDFCNKYRLTYLRKYTHSDIFSVLNAYLEVGVVIVNLWYKNDEGAIICYRTRLDGLESVDEKTGLEAFNIMSHYYKVPRVSVETPSLPRVKAFMWKSNEYEKKKVYAYSYDINSSYSFALLKDIPDTANRLEPGIVKNEDEISFDLDLNRVPVGKYADYRFPRMASPFTKFVEKWYNKKRKAKNIKDKTNAKCVMNYAIGYLNNINPFIRANVLYEANKLVESLIDENTIYCNTDSIVSLTKRNDLEFGDEIGQWKLEHEGYFAYIGFNCQWYGDKVSYRGIPNNWFDKDYDILEGKIPTESNIYYFDRKEFKICPRKEKEKN